MSLLSVGKSMPTHDSGILIDNANFRHSPNHSSSESFTQLKDANRVVAASEPRKRAQKQHDDVSIEQLEDYVLQRRDNSCDQLKDEYRQLPEGQQHPWDLGKSKANKHKNRFINIIACECTDRVHHQLRVYDIKTLCACLQTTTRESFWIWSKATQTATTSTPTTLK